LYAADIYFPVTSHQISLIDGYMVSDTDNYMHESERIMTRLAHDSQPGIWFVDLFPTRKWTYIFLAVSLIGFLAPRLSAMQRLCVLN